MIAKPITEVHLEIESLLCALVSEATVPCSGRQTGRDFMSRTVQAGHAEAFQKLILPIEVTRASSRFSPESVHWFT